MQFTDTQLDAAELLAEGRTRAETARCVQVSEATLYRWLAIQEFRQLVEQCRQFNQEQKLLALIRDQITDLKDGIQLLLDPTVPTKRKVAEATRLLKVYEEQNGT